jgi:hypothetical protein
MTITMGRLSIITTITILSLLDLRQMAWPPQSLMRPRGRCELSLQCYSYGYPGASFHAAHSFRKSSFRDCAVVWFRLEFGFLIFLG